MAKPINLYLSPEHVLTPPEIGPWVSVGSRKYNLAELSQEELEQLLRSPLTENFLNRAKRQEAKAAPVATKTAPAPVTAPDADGETATEEEGEKKKGKGK